MKKIIWAGPVLAGATLTALLLSTASAGDVVVQDRSQGHLTPQQAGGYFLSYVNEHCPAAAQYVRVVRVQRGYDKEAGTTHYSAACEILVSRTPAQAMNDMAAGDADDTLTVDLPDNLGKDENNLWVRGIKTVQLTPAEAGSYFGSYAAARCGVAASKVTRIRLEKTDTGYRDTCIGLDTMTIEAARDVLPNNTPERRVKIVGRVAE